MPPKEKLLSFRNKIQNATSFNEDFTRLIGIELYDYIQLEKVLKKGFESRLNYLTNLSKDKKFIEIQDNLFNATQKLLELVSLEEVEKRQAEWDGGRNRIGNYLKNMNVFAEKEEDEKVWLTLPELFLALQDKNNYFRLGDKGGRRAKEEISKHIWVMPVREQYEVNVDRFIEMVIFPKFTKDKEGGKKLDNLIVEYNRCWYELDELIYTKPIRLHTQKFEEFFHHCLEFHPRQGYEQWHDMFKALHQRDDKHFRNVKEDSLIVIDDLLEVLEEKAKDVKKNKADTKPTYEQNLFLLKTYYSKILEILDAFAGGFIAFRSPALNQHYTILVSFVDDILNEKGFEELKGNKPQLFESLIGDIEDYDVEWEYGKKPAYDFLGKIEKLYILSRTPLFNLPDVLRDFLKRIDDTISEYRKIRYEQWKLMSKRAEGEVEALKKQWDSTKEIPNPEQSVIQKIEITSMPELLVRNVEEIIVSKGKKQIHLPKLTHTDWKEAEIRFLTETDVIIQAGKKQIVADYQSLNFKDLKKDKPNTAWKMLLELARNGGETNKLPSPISETLRQQKSQLASRLKAVFRNDTDPFYDPEETETYRIRIKLIPPNSDEDKQTYHPADLLGDLP